MTTTVQRWTGLEAKALRAALRMTMHDFADYLGVGIRTVAKWESRGCDIEPQAQTQAILDTALARASSDAQERFVAAAKESRDGAEHAASMVPRAAPGGDSPIELDAPPVPQQGVLLPVVVDGRQVLLPLEGASGQCVALVANLASSLGDSIRLTPKCSCTQRADELYIRGQCLLPTNEKRQIEAATALLNRALDVCPRLAKAQAARAYARWRQYFAGWTSESYTLERAVNDVDAALFLDPGSIGAHSALIRICWDMGWHERALEVGRDIYIKNPESMEAALAFARALNNGGMAEAALPLTLGVLDVDPTNPTALKLLIWNHVMSGDCHSALNIADSYLQISGCDSNTRWAIALAELSVNDFSAAVSTAQNAVDMDPNDVTLWVLLGYLHRIAGHEAKAREVWSAGREFVDAYTGGEPNLRTESWLANIEACLGHTEEAHVKVARLVEVAPSNGYIKYRLFHVLAELGDQEAAVRMLRDAIGDGFLSIQLLQHEERMATAGLVDLVEYRRTKRILRRRVDRAKKKYVGSAENWPDSE